MLTLKKKRLLLESGISFLILFWFFLFMKLLEVAYPLYTKLLGSFLHKNSIMDSFSKHFKTYKKYLPGRGNVIRKVVFPERGLSIAPQMCWPQQFLQSWESYCIICGSGGPHSCFPLEEKKKNMQRKIFWIAVKCGSMPLNLYN